MRCSIQNHHGKLRLRFRWPLPGQGEPYQHAEATTLADTPENRAQLQPWCEKIGEQIGAGVFDYLAWFPNGRKAHVYLRARLQRNPTTETIRARYEKWIDLQPERVAHATYVQYQSHFRQILPIVGDRPVAEVVQSDVYYLRTQLLTRRLEEVRRKALEGGASEPDARALAAAAEPGCLKYVKNIVGGTFRAFVRDLLADGILERDPFATVTWKKIQNEGADPYEASERDAGLAALKTRIFRVGRGSGKYEERTHFAYYAAAYTIGWTGMRPEEVVALQVRDFEPKRPGFLVRRAAVAGKVGATKSLRSERWVAITPENAELVKLLIPLHAKPKQWVFRAPEGGMMSQGKLNDVWTEELKRLGIRPRGLYSLKDTFCSEYISTPGATWEWLSEQTGVAITTLKRHYTRFKREAPRDREEMDRIRQPKKGDFVPAGTTGTREDR